MTNQEQYELIWEKAKKYDKLVEAFDKIRAEIDNALSDGMIHKKTVLGIIDKYQKESEELADGKA